MIVVAQESHQHTFAAAVLDSYARLLDRAPEPVAERLLRDLAQARGLLESLPQSAQLLRAMRRVDRAGARRRPPPLGRPLAGISPATPGPGPSPR